MTVFIIQFFFICIDRPNRRLNRPTKLLIGFKIDLRLFEEKFYVLFAQNYKKKKIFQYFFSFTIFTLISSTVAVRIT